MSTSAASVSTPKALFSVIILLSLGIIVLMMQLTHTRSSRHEVLQSAGNAAIDPNLLRVLHSQRRLERGLQSLQASLERIEAFSLSMEDEKRARGDDDSRSEAEDEAAEAHASEAHAEPVAAAAAAPEQAASQAAAPQAAAKCSQELRPFHTLLTAQSSIYQQWQSRIMYYHWKKQRAAAGACSEMEGFTRLCATEGGKPDGLEEEIPSVFVEQLSDEVLAKHFHFGVLNRPNSITQLLASPALLSQISSEFVFIVETDHVFMQPIPNLATRDTPAAFVFGYMHAHGGQNEIIQKYWPEGKSSGLDPVGPSPLLIHLDQLRALTPRWLNFSYGLRSSDEAERVMQGWVQEMWGYSIAAASLGIKHKLVRNFQVEFGSLNRNVPEDFYRQAYIFHYTYGIEYTLQGQPQGINQIGEWSLDKRHYGADHPPRALRAPPEGANAAARWLCSAWNEASAGIERWPVSKSMGTLGWRRTPISAAQLASSADAKQIVGSQWAWAGVDGLEFAPGGKLKTPWGEGMWGIVPSEGGTPPVEDNDFVLKCNGCLFADFANANHNLRFDLAADPPSFTAVRVGDLAKVTGEYKRGGE